VIRNPLVHEDAMDRAAGLPVMLIGVFANQPGDHFRIGIVQYDGRAISSEFAFHPCAMPIACTQDGLPHTGGAGERYVAHSWMLSNAVSRDLAAPGQDVNNT